MKITVGSRWSEKRNKSNVATVLEINESHEVYPIKVGVSWGSTNNGNFENFGESYRCSYDYLPNLFELLED